jgi:hypothetical protein
MCHYLPFKLDKVLRQNSKTLKVLHQRKSLGNPAPCYAQTYDTRLGRAARGSFAAHAHSGKNRIVWTLLCAAISYYLPIRKFSRNTVYTGFTDKTESHRQPNRFFSRNGIVWTYTLKCMRHYNIREKSRYEKTTDSMPCERAVRLGSHDTESVVLPNRFFRRSLQWQYIIYMHVHMKRLPTVYSKITESVVDDIRFCHCKPYEVIR